MNCELRLVPNSVSNCNHDITTSECIETALLVYIARYRLTLLPDHGFSGKTWSQSRTFIFTVFAHHQSISSPILYLYLDSISLGSALLTIRILRCLRNTRRIVFSPPDSPYNALRLSTVRQSWFASKRYSGSNFLELMPSAASTSARWTRNHLRTNIHLEPMTTDIDENAFEPFLVELLQGYAIAAWVISYKNVFNTAMHIFARHRKHEFKRTLLSAVEHLLRMSMISQLRITLFWLIIQ